jgi:hypothetical protein
MAIEVFYAERGELYGSDPGDTESGIEPNEAGWYWWTVENGECIDEPHPLATW